MPREHHASHGCAGIGNSVLAISDWFFAVEKILFVGAHSRNASI
jgi:hypothetical protein